MKLLPISQAVSNAKTHFIQSYKDFPNSSLHNLPLVIYRPFADLQDHDANDSNNTAASQRQGKAEQKQLDPARIEDLLKKNDLISAWRYGMFPFNHYHSNTHEVLVPYKGTAELAFGHHESPHCVKHKARAGDVYILPAGIGHRALSSSGDFQMVGSYPAGSSNWDNCRGGEGNKEKEKQWESVKNLGKRENWVKMDPVYGDAEGSPLGVLWK